jgi:hypothetical protein
MLMYAEPNPSITEVLFVVPQKEPGDANKDGKRSATADEFVELCNTTDKPVDLKGWALIDSDSWAFLTEKGKKPWATVVASDGKHKADGKDWLFVFPSCTLKPGERAVVFNGFEQKPKGKVGSHEASLGKSDEFAGAFVFAMKVETAKVGFGNDGDWIALVSPAGKIVEVVKWGKPDQATPADAAGVVEAPAEPHGSVQRESPGGKFVDHATLGDKTKLFSPGDFETSKKDGKDAKPPSKKPDAKEKREEPTAPPAKPDLK